MGTGSTPAFKLIVPRLGGAVGPEAWEAAKAEQLAAYYRPNDDGKPADAPPAGEAAPEASDDLPPRPQPPKPSKIDFV